MSEDYKSYDDRTVGVINTMSEELIKLRQRVKVYDIDIVHLQAERDRLHILSTSLVIKNNEKNKEIAKLEEKLEQEREGEAIEPPERTDFQRAQDGAPKLRVIDTGLNDLGDVEFMSLNRRDEHMYQSGCDRGYQKALDAVEAIGRVNTGMGQARVLIISSEAFEKLRSNREDIS